MMRIRRGKRKDPGPEMDVEAAAAVGEPGGGDADGQSVADGDPIESGIAEIFAAIRAANDRADGSEPVERSLPPLDDGRTARLLDELDRLWQSAA